MPKTTFFNLPSAKKQLIGEVAIQEFATFGYDKASINRIVENCQIAKGSFYQYFENKKDLFNYIIGLIKEEKMKYLAPAFDSDSKYDFFETIKLIYQYGLQFAIEKPEMSKVATSLIKQTNHPIYIEMRGGVIEATSLVFEGLLKAAQKKKEIREDIDIKYISHMISHVMIGTSEYHLNTTQNNNGEVAYDEEVCQQEIMKMSELFIDLIKKGVQYKEEKND